MELLVVYWLQVQKRETIFISKVQEIDAFCSIGTTSSYNHLTISIPKSGACPVIPNTVVFR
jgi:hypothetical protein